MSRDLSAAIDRAKREILADIFSGLVPEAVTTFDELHNYVDATEYGGAYEDELFASEAGLRFWNAVQDAVNEWLQNGRKDRGSSIDQTLRGPI